MDNGNINRLLSPLCTSDDLDAIWMSDVSDDTNSNTISKKYELMFNKNTVADTADSIGIRVYRIKAIRNFGNVKAGDIGGFIQSENNLSHDGNCWVYNNAKVFGNARVSDNSIIQNNAKVFGNASISDNAKIYGNAKIYDKGSVSMNAKVGRYAQVYGNAKITDGATINENANIHDSALICGTSIVRSTTRVCGRSKIYGDAILSGNAIIRDRIITPTSNEPAETLLDVLSALHKGALAKKYSLLYDDTINIYCKPLYRIKALRDFRDVKAGDIGGYVQSVDNLRHEGDCWVYDNAKVFDMAVVSDNAKIYGCSEISTDARIYENASILGDTKVSGRSKIYGEVKIPRGSNILGSADISKYNDIVTISSLGDNDTITFFKDNFSHIIVNCNIGCYYNMDEFVKKIGELYGDNIYTVQYMVALSLAKSIIF